MEAAKALEHQSVNKMEEEEKMAKKLENIVGEYKISLRRISMNLNVNYNMMLKASKKPIIGQPYDPYSINWDEVESYILKKMTKEAFEAIDWEAMKDADVNNNVNLPNEWEVGTQFKLRGEDTIFEAKIVTTTHICFMDVEGTQPRVMSIPTFLHQSPKVVG